MSPENKLKEYLVNPIFFPLNIEFIEKKYNCQENKQVIEDIHIDECIKKSLYNKKGITKKNEKKNTKKTKKNYR